MRACLALAYNGVGTGGDGFEPAELLQVLVVLLLLFVVHLAARLLLAAVLAVAVEQVVVLLLLSHGPAGWSSREN